MRVDIHVTAHPKRLAMAEALVAQLPGATLWLDPYGIGPWANIRRAWAAPASGATHRIVLEEDVELCPDFVEVAAKAIAARPTEILDFFAIRPGMDEARAAGVHWISYGARAWGPAMAMPVALAHEMVAWADGAFRPEMQHGDARILLFAAHRGMRIFATAPSLVQHRADAPLIDETKEPNVARQSPWVAGPEANGIDWSGTALDLPGLWRLAGMRRKYLVAFP